MNREINDEWIRERITAGMDKITWPRDEKAALLAKLEGGIRMKKKVSFAFAFSLVLVMVLASCALALHGKEGAVPARQPIARVEKMSFVIPAEAPYPAQVLVVEDMRYDGKNLLIGYRMEGEAVVEEEPFEDQQAARRESEGLMFGSEGADLIRDKFPQVRQSKWENKSAHLARYEWVIMNALRWEGMEEGAAGCESTLVTSADDGLIYLSFRNLNADLLDRDVLSIRLPLLKAATRAVWYSDHENVYYGVTGSYGETKEIALSVPRQDEKILLPEGENVRESSVDLIREGGNCFTVPANGGFGACRIEIGEAVMQGSQMKITLRTESEVVTAYEIPEAYEYLCYNNVYPKESADEVVRAYYAELMEAYSSMQPGDEVIDKSTVTDIYLKGKLGEDLWQGAVWKFDGETVEDGWNTWYYIGGMPDDATPAWYGEETFTVYLPVKRHVDGIRVTKNGAAVFRGSTPDPLPAIPVEVRRTSDGDIMWEEPIYYAVGKADETEYGVFLIDNDVRLEIVRALYDGENIEIAYKLEKNDRFRVSQELETASWDTLGPWTDLMVDYEDDVIVYRYKIRDTMDEDDPTSARTADQLDWIGRDHVTVTLVIGKLDANGDLETDGAPRIRMLLQNTGK